MKKIILALISFWATVLTGYAQAGSLDLSFNPANSMNASINKMAVQPDGRIILCGNFTTYQSLSRMGIVRIYPDGSIDNSFNPGTGATSIFDVAIQPDGRIIIAGPFTSYNGVTRKRIARLNSDGSLDTTFNTGTGVDSTILVLTIADSGKILIGGRFSTVDGAPRSRIARLKLDGSLDTSFNPGAGIGTSSTTEVITLLVQPDGKYLLTGTFTKYDNVSRYKIVRVNNDGSLDTGFDPGFGLGGTARLTKYLPDGKILVVGSVFEYNDVPRENALRIHPDGSLDTLFVPAIALGPIGGSVINATIQPDGKILIVGTFEECNMASNYFIARIMADATQLDTSFNAGYVLGSYISEVMLQSDGKILVAGEIYEFNDTLRYRLARLHGDGTVTGIAGMHKESTLSIYPNPVANEINFSCSESNIELIQLYNLQGQLSREWMFHTSASTHSLHLNELPTGVYIAKIRTSSNNQVFTKKVVIE